MRDGHPREACTRCLRLAYGALIRARFQYLRIRVGDLEQAEIDLFDCAVGIGEGRDVIRNPLQELALVLNRGGAICGGDHIEPRGDSTVRPSLPLACVVRGQD